MVVVILRPMEASRVGHWHDSEEASPAPSRVLRPTEEDEIGHGANKIRNHGVVGGIDLVFKRSVFTSSLSHDSQGMTLGSLIYLNPTTPSDGDG